MERTSNVPESLFELAHKKSAWYNTIRREDFRVNLASAGLTTNQIDWLTRVLNYREFLWKQTELKNEFENGLIYLGFGHNDLHRFSINKAQKTFAIVSQPGFTKRNDLLITRVIADSLGTQRVVGTTYDLDFGLLKRISVGIGLNEIDSYKFRDHVLKNGLTKNLRATGSGIMATNKMLELANRAEGNVAIISAYDLLKDNKRGKFLFPFDDKYLGLECREENQKLIFSGHNDRNKWEILVRSDMNSISS